MNKGHAALAVICASLAGFYYFHDVKGKPQRQEAETKAKRLFPNLKKDELTGLTIERLKEVGKDKPLKMLMAKQHGQWVLDGKEPHLLSTMLLGQTTKSLAELQNSDEMGSPTPTALKPEEFGLDKPTYKLEMKSKDGQAYVLTLGDKTPDGKGYYAQAGGGPITSIDTTLPGVLETPEDKLRETSPVPFQPSKANKVQLTLKDGKKVSVEVAKPREKPKEELDDNIEITDLNEEWKMTVPTAAGADATKVRDLLWNWKNVKHGRFLKPDEKIDFSKPELRVEAFIDGETEPYVFEVGPSVPAKPTMRYLRRLGPEEVMVFEINNPKLLDINEGTLEQKHLAVFEPDTIKKIDLKVKDISIVGSRTDKGERDWQLSQPSPGNPTAAQRNAAVGEILFELKGLEWKSKSSETAFTESASFQLFDKEGKAILKATLGQESGKGRLAKVDGVKEVLLLEPDPLAKLESMARRVKEAVPTPTPTPAASGMPGVPGMPGQPGAPILIQNGKPVTPQNPR